jgi:type II secretory pathway component PulM
MKWLDGLTQQEKNLLKYGSIIVIIAIFWVFVYKPVNHAIATKNKQIIMLHDQYQQMQASESQLSKQKSDDINFHRDINKPFISWIDEQLEQRKLSQFVSRSEPKDNKTLILTFENVVFDKLVKWLEPLELNYNIKIAEADINLTDRSSGLCNARLTLEELQ